MEKSLNTCVDTSLAEQIAEEFSCKSLKPGQFSPLALAYIGDCIFDLIIRTVTVEHGNAPVNKLHRRVSGYVKAPSQMKMFHLIEEELTEEEMQVFKRGRNAKSYTSAKNASITEYRIATGFEALIGYLYLDNRFDRALELLHMAMERFDAQSEEETEKREKTDAIKSADRS